MSNTRLTAKRLARWFLINLFVAAVLCAITGRYQDPWLWAYVAAVAAIGLYPDVPPRRRPGERTIPPARAGSRSFAR